MSGKMTKIIKIVIGILVFIIAIGTALNLILAKGDFKLDFKIYFLFGLLGWALIAYFLRINWLRYVTLLVSLAYLGFYEAGCLCSNGAFESIFMYLGTEKVARIGVNLFRISILAGVIYFFGNLFCGWVCPKGAVQEFIFQQKYKIRINKTADRILNKLRYLFLALIIFYPIFIHKRIFNKIDPFKMVFNFTGPMYILIFMTLVLVASIFIYRPFCRYICPLGAFLGLMNRIGIYKLKPGGDKDCICGEKGACVKKCPSQAITKKEQLIINKEFCFSCLECEESCPNQKKG